MALLLDPLVAVGRVVARSLAAALVVVAGLVVVARRKLRTSVKTRKVGLINIVVVHELAGSLGVDAVWIGYVGLLLHLRWLVGAILTIAGMIVIPVQLMAAPSWVARVVGVAVGIVVVVVVGNKASVGVVKICIPVSSSIGIPISIGIVVVVLECIDIRTLEGRLLRSRFWMEQWRKNLRKSRSISVCRLEWLHSR